MKQKLSIRELTELYHISARTLRFYEEAGIMKSHRKECSRYREYDSEQIKRLEIILLLRRLSFSVQDITKMLNEDGQNFQSILNHRMVQNDRQFIEMRETNQLLHKLSSELRIKSPSEITLSEILSEFMYLTKQTERMNVVNNLDLDNKNRFSVAIGTEIVAGLINEINGDLIGKIKELRAEIDNVEKNPLPIIRIYDTKDVSPNCVTLVWDNVEVWSKDYSGQDEDSMSFSDDIISQIKKYYHNFR